MPDKTSNVWMIKQNLEGSGSMEAYENLNMPPMDSNGPAWKLYLAFGHSAP
jgi:hypothetical protein